MTKIGGCENGIFDSISNTYYNTCNVVVGASPTGGAICQKGDSGGPIIFHRDKTSLVRTVGIISGYTSNGNRCVGQNITSILNRSGLSIVLG